MPPNATIALLLTLFTACVSSEPTSEQVTGVPVLPHPPPGSPGAAAAHPPPPEGSGSGGAFQDPMGFPGFHNQPAPAGPSIQELGTWTEPVLLSETTAGGYRPQLTITRDGTAHAVYYARAEQGDLLRHRHSTDGKGWSQPAQLGFAEHRNWGPDLITASDDSLIVVFDHILPDFSSRGYLTTWRDGHWTDPLPLTPDDGGEVGSGHIAELRPGELAYVWIGRQVQGADPFRAWARWRTDGIWQPPTHLSDGSTDAWHTNVERRLDASALVGFDLGRGGSETTLFVAEGRAGSFSAPENISATGRPGERPHFAFQADGTDHVTWFHKEAEKPVHVYVRSGKPGSWGPVSEPSAGYGGYHFDPEIAVNHEGVRCLVWGWDAGDSAEMVYSVDTGQGWSPPRLLAALDEGKPGLASLTDGPDGHFHAVWNQGTRGESKVFYASFDPSEPPGHPQ